jgi:glycosyltransferase involved in cell wall biosynthesis
MKILMLLENEYLKDSRVIKEVQTLNNAGHDVIIATSTTSDLPSVEKSENCIILRRRIPQLILKSSVGALKVPFYFNFWRKYVSEVLHKHTIDVIHIHDLPLCRIGIEFKNKNKIKLVVDLHENWPALLAVSSHTNTLIGRILSSQKQWRRYEKKCCQSADRIITVVHEMKERISKLGIPSEKIFILENTPSILSVKELKFERDERYFTLIYVGGISFHRGLQYAISGLKLLVPELPVRLWIAGNGKYVAMLKNQIKNLQLEKYVEFLGILTKAEIEDLHKKADFGLIPHIRSEQSDNSSPNKLFEYMAAGLPVLASNCTSVKRVLDNTQAGLTYVYDSSSDFSNVVRSLYYDRIRSDIFAENGRRAIREKYNWEKGSFSLVKLYSDLGL